MPSEAATPDPGSPTHEYRFCLRDRLVCLRQSPDTLFYRSVFPQSPIAISTTQEALQEAETLAWLRDYFQLDVDLVKLYDDWSMRDPVFMKLRDRFSGIRMLRQDPWENLVSSVGLLRVQQPVLILMPLQIHMLL